MVLAPKKVMTSNLSRDMRVCGDREHFISELLVIISVMPEIFMKIMQGAWKLN